MQSNSNLASKIRRNAPSIVLALLFIAEAIWGGTQYARVREYQRALDSMYEMSYFELVDAMENLDVRLSKLIVTASPGESMELLSEISRQSDSASASLNNLPSTHPEVAEAMKFLNVLGDYCRVLINQSGDGNIMDSEAYDNLASLHQACVTLRTGLDQVDRGNLKYERRWQYYDVVGEGQEPMIPKSEKGGVEYPSIIYDGPFSEGLEERTPKGLRNEEISRDQAREKAASIVGCNIDELADEGEEMGKIPGYTFNYGNVKYICITKQGGELLWLMTSGGPYQEQLDEAKCTEIAQTFLKTINIDQVTPTWTQIYDGQIVISFAATQEDVVLYPDLVKVKVDMEYGSILGCETKGYWMNHEDRQLPTPEISLEEASMMLSPLLKPVDGRKTLIPTGGGNEVLCYEFTCEYDQSTFFVYINALTGKQERIFKVVDTPDGSLVV